MSDITILLMVENRSERTALCIESLRKFPGSHNISLVVADNYHPEGLWNQAQEQTDFTYIYFDEPNLTYGDRINQIIEGLDIHTHLMITEDFFLFTPILIDRLVNDLEQNEQIGILAPEHASAIADGGIIPDYSKICEWMLSEHNETPYEVLGMQRGCVLFTADLLAQFGNFDSEFTCPEHVFTDAFIRTLKLGKKIKICRNAIGFTYHHSVHSSSFEQEMLLLEAKYGMHYFNIEPNNNLTNLISHKPSDAISILEIGCDCGANLLGFKKKFPNATLYGAEINKAAVFVANCVVDAIYANIEEENLPYEKNSFDYIVFGDVLEHLRNPLQTIIYCKQFLKKGGRIITSIPNVMHISVVQDLLKGNFTYTETGLLDRTHIHLFTFNEIIRMFRDGGYKVEIVRSSFLSIPDEQKQLIDKLIAIEPETNREFYETFQYLISAQIQ